MRIIQLKPSISKYGFMTAITVVCAMLFLPACSKDSSSDGDSESVQQTTYVENPPVYPSEALPADLEWVTNNKEPVFASPQAKKGGRFRTFMLAFPLTLRSVGPDSNSSFRSFLDGNRLSLTSLHPNTDTVIPELASHWAYGDDGKTIYYRLNPQAKWSDGKPVVADDYLFALEFMRSQYIVAPWYNNHYSEQIKSVKKYDDHTISITGATQKPRDELHYYYSISPLSRHFHKLDENWVVDYNWRVEPTVGPYIISKIKKGKLVEFSRVQQWWGEDLRYFKNRFNVDSVKVTVIRDAETAYRHFIKGELDSFSVLLPSFWHEKAQGELYDKGYIHKIWYHTDQPQPSQGMYLNQQHGFLGDINMRLGLAHSMNIDLMIRKVLRNDYARLHNLHTGYGKYSHPNIRAREFDLQKAEDYFSKAGWSERGPDGIRVKAGQRLSVKVTYSAPYHTDRLVVLKEEAKKAGVELLLEQLDGSTAFKKILEKKHAIAWMGWSTGFRPAYWQHFHSENAHKPQTNNITNTDKPEIDALITRYRAEIKSDKRAEYAQQLQEMIHDQGAVIPTYMVAYTREAHWRWLRLPEHFGTKTSKALFSPFGAAGGLFWIDAEEKQNTDAARENKQAFEPVTILDSTYKVN